MQRGEAFAVGVACLGKRCLRSLDIRSSGQTVVAATFGDILAVYNVAGGKEAVSRLGIDLHNVVDDGLAVNGKAERLTNQRIVKRSGRAVDVVVDGAVAGAGLHTGLVCLQTGIVGGRDGDHTVNLAGLIGGQSGSLIEDIAEGQLVQRDAVGVPVVLVLFEDDVLVHAHTGDLEGAVADIGFCLGRPGVAVGFYGGLLDGVIHPHAQHIDEVRGRLLEGDLQRLGIDCLYAQILCRAGAVIEFLRTLDVIRDHADVLCAGGGGQNVLDGVDEVLGGHVGAVAPFQTVTQVEGVGQAVVADIPRFGTAGHNGTGAVIGDQTFKAVQNYILRKGVVGHGGVQTVRNVVQHKRHFLSGRLCRGHCGGRLTGSAGNIGDVLGLAAAAARTEQRNSHCAGKYGAESFLFHGIPSLYIFMFNARRGKP